jgi:hypothetical protein
MSFILGNTGTYEASMNELSRSFHYTKETL